MKRYLWLAIIIVFLLGTVACQKKEKGPEGTERTKFVSEDYNPTNRSFMKTEKGIYYYNETQKALRYFDFASERDIYLCNKPECKHDGNAFCVATNARYSHDIHILYNGKIVAPAVEETDTQYLMKLLVISLDGSQLEDYATMLTIERTEGLQRVVFRDVQIHRNKLMVSFRMYGDRDLEDADYIGAFLYDLDTGETTSLNEELFSKENKFLGEIRAQGDYFYYYRQVSQKKKMLYRYHIVNKTEEECTPEAGFAGDYYILDDDHMYYQWGTVGLVFYRISTKELLRIKFNGEGSKSFDEKWDGLWIKAENRVAELNAELELNPNDKELQSLIEQYERLMESERGKVTSWGRSAVWIGTDKQNIYRLNARKWCLAIRENENQVKLEHVCNIPLGVYDQNGEYVKFVNLADAFTETGYFSEESEGYNNVGNGIDLYFQDETVFCCIHEPGNDRIYRMNRQEMLGGTAKAELVCVLTVR